MRLNVEVEQSAGMTTVLGGGVITQCGWSRVNAGIALKIPFKAWSSRQTTTDRKQRLSPIGLYQTYIQVGTHSFAVMT